MLKVNKVIEDNCPRNRDRVSGMCYLYTILAVFSTLFELYGISKTYHTFTWRFAFVLGFLLLAFINALSSGKLCVSKFSTCILPFLTCVVISFFVNMFLGTEGFELRLIRFFLYVSFSVSLAAQYFEGRIAYKLYSFLVWIATIVLIAQVIGANFLGISISGHLPFVPLRSTIYENAKYILRYYSIFEEPGYYGIYVLPYVCLMLMNGRIKIVQLLCILVSLLLSTSTSNLAVFGFIILTYVLFVHNEELTSCKEILIKVAIIIGGIIIVCFFTQTNQYQFIMRRLESGVSLESRLMGYNEFWSYFDGNLGQFLFGNGMEVYPISGYATLVIVFGVIGAVAYFYAIIRLFFYTNKEGKYLLVAFMFINIGNVEFLGNASSMMIVFPFVIWYAKKKDCGENVILTE